MNKKINILILSHGKLAQELYNTAKMIIGAVEDVFYFNFLQDMQFSDLEKKVLNFIKERKDSDILIFTDLFGGSCFNICSKIIKLKNVRVFSGVNLGLLLEAIFLKKTHDLESLAKNLYEKKNDTMVYVNKEINRTA